MIRIALPKDRLWPDSQRFLRHLGVSVPESCDRYVHTSRSAGVEVILLKIQDIPDVLADGLVDLAVASDEWLLEGGIQVRSLATLCWYHARLCVMAPAGAPHPPASIDGPVRVATPFPRLARRLLGGSGYAVRAVRGAAEAYPGRLTDLAVDCVETGSAARRNGLVVVDELARCDVRLVSLDDLSVTDPSVRVALEAAHQCGSDPQCDYGRVSPVSRAYA